MAWKDIQSRLRREQTIFPYAHLILDYSSKRGGKPSLAESSTRQLLLNMSVAVVLEFLGTCGT
eukprot:6031444-Pleurochrysis_carterae.AAC.1